MASRKSIVHPMVEELRNSSPTSSPSSSSPLRRRSSIAQRTVAANLDENDDEAERLARRLEMNRPAASSRNDKRKSFGLGFVAQMSHPQIAERVSRCIKLGAENKINTKNAFSLEMIDFMTYLIKKQDGNMSNLQVASTSLDVSTKIYGFRVDGVHTDIMKMIGGMDKQDKNDGRSDGDNHDIGENTDERGETEATTEAQAKAKKKRKSKQKILASVESLRGNVETMNPSSLMFSEGDSQTTDLLYQAILPYHANSGIYLNPHNDVILDIVDPTIELSVNSTPMACPRIENFDDNDMCQSFANFEFLGWSADEEIDLTPEKSQKSNDGFQFDLDASLPADDKTTNFGLNYYDMDDDDNNENVDNCRGPSNTCGPANIVDFRQVVQASRHVKNSEYSYFQDNVDIQWAGPSHWKIRHATRHNLAGSRVVEGCGQEAVRRRKELLFSYNDETNAACREKFNVSRGNNCKLQAKTAKNYWSEDKLTLPRDIHYVSSQCCKFYLRPDVMMKFPDRENVNATHVSDEIGNYDYNNELDTTDYCPNVGNDEQPANDDDPCANIARDYDDENCPPTQAFTGDNLVEAPKINSKIFIPYSQRAKKIDMRQLKKSIWKKLTFTSVINEEQTESVDKANVENLRKIDGTKNFSEIYKELPKCLSKSNAEALSFPIAFISLLHLANEKNLIITSTDDRSDLLVKED